MAYEGTKRAVILHGTNGNPGKHWFPWLKQKLESEGYEVWVPLLPENSTPNKDVYGDFLFGSDWDFTNNLIVGHSSGAVEILNLLMDERCPKVRTAVLVGAWKGGAPNEHDYETFKNLFPKDGFKFELIKSKSEKIVFLHGDNDPYCPLEQAEYLAKELDAPITVVPGGRHFSGDCTEIPELWDILKEDV